MQSPSKARNASKHNPKLLHIQNTSEQTGDVSQLDHLNNAPRLQMEQNLSRHPQQPPQPLGEPFHFKPYIMPQQDTQADDVQGNRSERAPHETTTGNRPAPGKKTKGRVKLKMEFIDNKLRRYTTFSKRKTGIMKKAYELSMLTGTQVMLLVASETGHVYTFATKKLQPMITSDAGKALIQTCLNSPDPQKHRVANSDQRMSATGFEETELSCNAVEGIDDEEHSEDHEDRGYDEEEKGKTDSDPNQVMEKVSNQVKRKSTDSKVINNQDSQLFTQCQKQENR